jgi:hypothetical protein
MSVKQIAVSLENVPGKLSAVSDLLGENGINIIALSVVDTADLTTVRFVPADPEKASNVLKSQGYSIKVSDVLAVETPNHPGGLNAILRPLKEVSINVNYLYTCLGTGDKTVVIMSVDKMEDAARVLKRNWVRLYDEEELYRI